MKTINATDTAQLVRGKLKESFPGVSFSVRTSKYSGGSCIDVYWTDGPAESKVRAAVGDFHGAEFDGMQDLKYYNDAPYRNDFIFLNRQISEDKILTEARNIVGYYGGLDGLDPTKLNEPYPALYNFGFPSLRNFALHNLKDKDIL